MVKYTKPSLTSGYSMRGRQGLVIEKVGRMIIGQHFEEGSFLPKESELIELTGFSRTSVREAMRVLAAKGLLEIRQKIGTRVRPAQQWNVFDTDILRWHLEEDRGEAIMRDLIEVRQIVEPAAARLAAGRVNLEDHRRLSQAIDAMRANVDMRTEYTQADVEFHLDVYAATHNVLLRQFGSVIADVLKMSFTIQQNVSQDVHILENDVESHAEIYWAIDRAKGEEAEKAMLRVVLDGKSSLIKALTGIKE